MDPSRGHVVAKAAARARGTRTVQGGARGWPPACARSPLTVAASSVSPYAPERSRAKSLCNTGNRIRMSDRGSALGRRHPAAAVRDHLLGVLVAVELFGVAWACGGSSTAPSSLPQVTACQTVSYQGRQLQPGERLPGGSRFPSDHNHAERPPGMLHRDLRVGLHPDRRRLLTRSIHPRTNTLRARRRAAAASPPTHAAQILPFLPGSHAL